MIAAIVILMALQNGVYFVAREGTTPAEARMPGDRHRVLVYDKKYSQADRNEPARYVAIDTASFVPLILAGSPEARKDERGFTLLRLKLAREHVKTLENFTRAHLGAQVAIVLDGEIVTMHKVRSVITGGDVQISRCQDDACQVLRAKLAKD